MILLPEKLEFKISTTDLKAVYTESGGVKVKVEIQSLKDFENDRYREVEFTFVNVAQLKCTTLNFFEARHEEYKIECKVDDTLGYWKETGINPDPGVYSVGDSKVLGEKGTFYDPANRLQLKHFLIVGYDSYVEIIASRYDIGFKRTHEVDSL